MFEEGACLVIAFLDVLNQDRQQGLTLTGAVGGVFVDPASSLAQAADLARWHRAGRDPLRPAFGLVVGPGVQVITEAADADHDAVDTGTGFAVVAGADHVPPGRVDLRVDVQVGLVGLIRSIFSQKWWATSRTMCEMEA
ncbi:hypothetical protein [Actinophytocola sp.]|uniref:hypothetical protein n=1 Tax=Actinophytocola sp. TaxID=1872138 RepID=UPI003D6BED42